MTIKTTETMNNIIAINKPQGYTSHDVIARLRGILGVKKIGHAGTLDPMATAVLVVAIGREATKQIATIVAKEKEYIAEVTFGATSDTDDADGQLIIREVPAVLPTIDDIKALLPSFIGTVKQRPPAYSALKIKGKRAYALARAGKVIEMEPREVIIKDIEVINYAWPQLQLRIVTGPGVYIRAIARDIGEWLGVGAHLTKLQRTRVGEYRIDDAKEIDEIRTG